MNVKVEIQTKPKVAVLMAVFEGARFLPEQLSSIQAQSHGNFELWVSRDCGREDVGAVLEEYAPAFGTNRFFVLEGPKKGCAANFVSLVFNPEIQADYFAYSDQDDIWERDKLSRAIAALEGIPEAVPALYGSRSRLIDENGRGLGLSPLHGRPPSFNNALVQNIASGHTMVMNRAARELLRASGVTDVPFHDWWTYLLVTGAGGHVLYDPQPSVRYRQHARNLTGLPVHPRDHFQRIRRLIEGQVRSTNVANIRALNEARPLLAPESRCVLDTYSKSRKSRLLPRLKGIRKAGVYRQTRMENIGLLTASLLNKL